MLNLAMLLQSQENRDRKPRIGLDHTDKRPRSQLYTGTQLRAYRVEKPTEVSGTASALLCSRVPGCAPDSTHSRNSM